MGLLPGSFLDMSSHFIPLPRSSMIKASSSGDHLLCFFAGDSAACGGIVRFPVIDVVVTDAEGGAWRGATLAVMAPGGPSPGTPGPYPEGSPDSGGGGPCGPCPPAPGAGKA